MSKFPDDAESLINVVKSLPGVRDKPVRGKYSYYNYFNLKMNLNSIWLWKSLTMRARPILNMRFILPINTYQS